MYFKQFFDDDLIKQIAGQTNLYLVQCTGISNYLTNEAGENARRWNKKNTSFEEV